MDSQDKRPVGRPFEGGRTSKVVRIPKEWDVKEMIDIYVLIHAHYDGRQEGIASGRESTGRDWTKYDRLMLEVRSIIDKYV